MVKYVFLVRSASASDIGQKRTKNEDAVGVFEPSDEQAWRWSGALYVLADGVGGAAHGEVASRYAVQKVLYEYYRRADVPPTERLRQIIQQVGNEIYTYGRSEAGGGHTMATTLVAAVVWGEQLIVANVGDSRAYLVRNGRAEQITVDHSLVGEMVQKGLLSPEEARHAKVKNRLTRSLGGRANPKVDIFTHTLQPGDRIVLCSDGLTRYASAEDIAHLANAPSPAEAVQQMIAFANQRGGADNISAIVVEVGQPVPPEEMISTGVGTQITAPPPLGTEAPLQTHEENLVISSNPPTGQSQAVVSAPRRYLAGVFGALLVILIGCILGSAMWWGVHSRKESIVGSPLTAQVVARAVASDTPTSSATPSPTFTPLPTPTPSPTLTFTPTPPLAIVPPSPSPTWTALPPGTYACLGIVPPGGSFYGLLAQFELLSPSASAMEFWQTWAKTGRFPEVWITTKDKLSPDKPVDHRTFRRVPVPKQSGPNSTAWETFLDALTLHPGDAVLLPGVERMQCITQGGLWQPFKSLPPWMRTFSPATPPIPTPTP